jgi:hypothetical protein
LAWYLAAELCDRFYASHGIVPMTIEHEGLGYYGIVLAETKCPVHGPRQRQLGRLTAHGDVENWVTGGPGDHGLKLEARARAGEPVGPMVAAAISHLRLPPFPKRSHATCRHKRWGDSYRLVFRVAALLALRHDELVVWNDPCHAGPDEIPVSAEHPWSEPPGSFFFHWKPATVSIAGDGRILEPSSQASLWESYMRGSGEMDLVRRIESLLDLPVPSSEAS